MQYPLLPNLPQADSPGTRYQHHRTLNLLLSPHFTHSPSPPPHDSSPRASRVPPSPPAARHHITHPKHAASGVGPSHAKRKRNED
ncbi:hypothetical protein EJ06DRAFT_531595 [Trichodelitschia bisporula]|uniref:Uncharacterized protein n=1 Tax=Trichodelitschia bisporula TaxID=703511 RepID=A0A6G1HTM7_9PEZI|nr:hypothetical protein EJ06DRAFT_531595 [Trichodelitschia bisporula]